MSARDVDCGVNVRWDFHVGCEVKGVRVGEVPMLFRDGLVIDDEGFVSGHGECPLRIRTFQVEEIHQPNFRAVRAIGNWELNTPRRRIRGVLFDGIITLPALRPYDFSKYFSGSL